MKLLEVRRTSATEHFAKIKVGVEPTSAPADVVVGERLGGFPFRGFGGAITEAATSVLSLMDEKQRKGVLQSYFCKSGLNYQLARLPIGASDFALGSYDYLEGEDRSLKSFSLSHEERYLIPVLKEIKELRGAPLTFLASPWSPCAWMKDNHDVLRGGHLLKECYPLWAEYECRYLEEMAKRGYPISMISIQNEPQAIQRWESCIYSAEEEADYALVLRQKLDEHHLGKVGIYIWDHNRDLIVERADTTLANPKINAAVEGIAFHWYISEDFAQVRLTHERHPDKHLLFSEGCIETVDQTGVTMGAFANGERYARNIIGDLNAFADGWIDWNIVLDEQGGPNHVGNYCEAPIQYDRKTHTVLKNHTFYCIEQFSHFIQAGAQLRELKSNLSSLQGVAFDNCDGTTILVLWNSGTDASVSLSILNGVFRFESKAHSVTSYLFK